MTRIGGRFVATVAVLILALVGASGVAAHADLIASEPAAGSTVAGSPSTIRLTFSQPLKRTSQIELFTGQFQPVTGLTTVVAGSEMRAVLGQPLAPATYTVQWTAVSDDGHSTEGSYQFAVTQASQTAGNRTAPLVAAIAAIIGGGVAIFAWILNRRQRL
jgi:methionine-rich copper-binding protein CopC